MDRFVARLNIEHYCVRLRSESDARARLDLQKLLVEEENKLGFDLEMLARIEHEIATGNDRIARQESSVESLESNGHDASTGRTTLAMMRETLVIYEDYRHRLLLGIERNGLL